ncbi:naringenin-chalcone synthase [Pontibacillus halophilus JSM 076056 = DSM 19796]|uniref:Naringenin-chalcone synthase n=1 Tax=Pontibacillus halophilus JSM 076056 = DSM 19796 TaxID=1385510 RepID=A0A0A5GL43_9BACI|nr:type III polyketide synthase [Pontibacillus halophilus]KGX91933.1 naringenin-chalcone synthase [Pontibacillus halophilus JSM 076056 = DSM 19796]
MAYVASVGVSIPPNEITQAEIKEFVRHIFPRSEREVERLLPVFENASVERRQFVVPKEWFEEDHGFMDRNLVYEKKSLEFALEAADACLTNTTFLTEPIHYDAIDVVIFVSSTGVATPTIDARMMNERAFRTDTKRIPIWGLGCAGGSSGMARAMDYVLAHPKENVLIVTVELCGLTFQKNDHRKSNFIGTALFGDGVAASLVMGEQSTYRNRIRNRVPVMKRASSRLMKDALDVMGWNVNDHGFEVVFSRSIPRLVETFWKDHVTEFTQEIGVHPSTFPFFVAHPGGTKVLEAYEAITGSSSDKFKYSYDVLRNHGNMSSSTVIHVLKSWMEEFPPSHSKSLLAALGPGFSSELVYLEWSE